MPFARGRSGHTRNFEDLVAWLVTKIDKTMVSGFARISWRTVGAICERVIVDVLDPDRLSGLVDIGVDEIFLAQTPPVFGNRLNPVYR